jgi:hypothetical protein
MLKLHKVLFREASREVKRELHELARYPQPRLIQTSLVSRPKRVTLCDGRTVDYVGP